MTDALRDRLTLLPAAVELTPLPWLPGSAPTPVPFSALLSGSLPTADVLVVTWTAAEWMALADVLTPGVHKTAWLRYAKNWATFEPQLTDRSPAREAKCLAEYQLTMIGSKRVLCVHSQLHLATDSTTAPIVSLWRQMIEDVQPSLVITTGTAGGIGAETVLGDVFVVSTAKFNCVKDFKDKPWAQARFSQDPPAAGPYLEFANKHLMSINAGRLPADLTPRPPAIYASGGSVETVDYFGFADTGDRYGIVGDDPTAHTEEMDDATLPLAITSSEFTSPPRWLSIRNASDPEVPTSIGDLAEQKGWASGIYERYGYYTTVGSAIACWAVIADL